MLRRIAGGMVTALIATVLTSMPSASAGCQYGGPVISKCDGPIQPDGTWQRCVATPHLVYQGASSFLVPERACDQMAPGLTPGGPGFSDPPVHIDG